MDAAAPNSPSKDVQHPTAGLTDEEAKQAAILIQKTFRGHRERRQLNGFGLDASTRWYEAVKDAKYYQITKPKPPRTSEDPIKRDVQEGTATSSISPGREKWTMVTEIARRAGADDISPSITDFSSSDELSDSGQPPQSSELRREEAKKRRAQAIAVRKKTAKIMDLQYFLEMVDQKHRYGSSLRKYHNYWKTQDTDQNFFYWLDFGDGREVELPECSRARLDKEQVRYLSREERLKYLVEIDNEGRLIWAKNGERVWTKDELFKDSVNGIVPVTDPSPEFRYNVPPATADGSASSSSSEDEDSDNTAGDEGERYVNEDFHRASGISKVKHVSAAVLFNHMIRSSLKKGHKWIYVCDVSFRLYIGYKQSGAFQHSSFLHGARILSAGLIKVKRGQLRKLSPLSGHYRPPAANFRAFVHSLRDAGADMSHVSISRSYAVLVGMESYVHTQKRVKTAEKMVIREKDKLLHPEKLQQEEEANRDKSQSAEKERLLLEQQRKATGREGLGHKAVVGNLNGRFSRALAKFRTRKSPSPEAKEKRVPGTGPEDGIPAPEGRR